MHERILFEERDVTVTDTHLHALGSSYELGGITSVSPVRVPAAATGPIVMGVVGALALLSLAGETPWLGLLTAIGFLGGALLWWTRKRPTFQVRLHTSSGEVAAVESPDEGFVERVVRAVQEARAPNP